MQPNRRWVTRLGDKGRRNLFATLAIAVFVLSVDIQGLTGAGDPKSSRAPVKASVYAAWTAADSSARQFLEKEHEAIVAEIQLRNELEHLLFALKFALVGGTLYLLFQQAFSSSTARFQRTEFTSLVSWAAVVAAAIVDLRLATNQRFIITLGGWVRQYEHLRLGERSVALGWEAFLADHLLSQPLYPALRFSSQILTALLFCITAAMFFRYADRPAGATRAVSCAGAVLSIALMTIAAVSLRPNLAAIMIDLVVGSTATAVVFLLSFDVETPAKKLRMRPARVASEPSSTQT